MPWASVSKLALICCVLKMPSNLTLILQTRESVRLYCDSFYCQTSLTNTLRRTNHEQASLLHKPTLHLGNDVFNRWGIREPSTYLDIHTHLIHDSRINHLLNTLLQSNRKRGVTMRYRTPLQSTWAKRHTRELRKAHSYTRKLINHNARRASWKHQADSLSTKYQPSESSRYTTTTRQPSPNGTS